MLASQTLGHTWLVPSSLIHCGHNTDTGFAWNLKSAFHQDPSNLPVSLLLNWWRNRNHRDACWLELLLAFSRRPSTQGWWVTAASMFSSSRSGTFRWPLKARPCKCVHAHPNAKTHAYTHKRTKMFSHMQAYTKMNLRHC